MKLKVTTLCKTIFKSCKIKSKALSQNLIQRSRVWLAWAPLLRASSGRSGTGVWSRIFPVTHSLWCCSIPDEM